MSNTVSPHSPPPSSLLSPSTLSSQAGFNTARWRLWNALAMKAAEEANKEAEKAAKHTEELYSNPQTTQRCLLRNARATEAKQRAVEADGMHGARTASFSPRSYATASSTAASYSAIYRYLKDLWAR